MILYLTSEAKNEYLDFIDNLADKELQERRLPIMKLKKLYIGGSLQSFINQDFRNYYECEYLVIDINVFAKEGYEEIISAIKSISYVSSARVIPILSGYVEKNKMQSMLLQNGIKNIITADERSLIIDELQSALTPEGIVTFDRKKVEENNYDKIIADFFSTPKEEYIFKNDRAISIAFMSVGNCAGTTTNALNMTNFLESIGARTCYVENNNSGSLSFYKKILKDNTLSNCIKIGEAECFINNQQNFYIGEKDFIVYDCGKVVTDQFIKSDIKVVCCSITTNEIKELLKFRTEYHIDGLVFISHSVQEDIYSILGPNLDIAITKINNNADYNSFDMNKDVFLSLIEEYCVRKRTL